MPATIYTPATAPSYCTTDDVLYDVNRTLELGTEETTKVEDMIAAASRWVDQQTSRWFYLRNLQVTTEASGDGQQRLFLPAPVVTLASVTEDGIELDLDNVLIYPSALEKRSQTNPSQAWGLSLAKFWSMGQQAVVVLGHMGYETVPTDIKKLTAHVAGGMLGWGVKNYVKADGVESTVINTDILPDWCKATLTNYGRTTLHGQDFMLTDVATS